MSLTKVKNTTLPYTTTTTPTLLPMQTTAAVPQADIDLLALLQNAATQERGFRELMRTHQERLYWHVRRMVQDHEDANDILQNTLIRAYRSIDRFKGESRIYTWLYRIATNECITFLNKKKNTNILSMDNDELLSWQDQLPSDTPLASSDDILAKLDRAIATLPDKQRLVFNMRYYDELAYKDMSEMLGTSEGALKASFHHAARKIEDFLRNQ